MIVPLPPIGLERPRAPAGLRPSRAAIPALLLLTAFAATGARADGPSGAVLIGRWDGSATAAGPLEGPRGLALSADVVFVTDSRNARVLRFNPEGVLLGSFGTPGAGPSQFVSPAGIAAGAAVYVADEGNDRIQVFTYTGSWLGAWPTPSPYGVAVESSGDVLVTDPGHHRIRRYDPTGMLLLEWSSLPPGEVGLSIPMGIAAAPNGDVLVADFQRDRIEVFAHDSTHVGSLGAPGSGEGALDAPVDVDVDPSGVYVSDVNHHRIVRYDAAGAVIATWGTEGSSDGQFHDPLAVDAQTDQEILVADYVRGDVQKFQFAKTAARRVAWARIKSLYR